MGVLSLASAKVRSVRNGARLAVTAVGVGPTMVSTDALSEKQLTVWEGDGSNSSDHHLEPLII